MLLMYDEVVYVVKNDLHYYPPCVSQIRHLNNLGVKVEVWYGSSNQSAINVLSDEHIQLVDLHGAPNGQNAIGKLKNWRVFRASFLKKISQMSVEKRNSTLFWFGNTESVIPLVGGVSGLHYVLTSLELLDDEKNSTKRKLFGKIAKKAEAVVSCEETRSYIMKYWYGLNKLPYTMPNKPYSLGVDRKCVPSCEQTEKAISQIQGKKFIIYQGIFQNTEYMCELAKALRDMNSDYYLVMMGFDTHNQNIISTLQGIYDKVIHLESIPAPLHLEVTSHATIGLVFYSSETLNKAFCAPNKIYEYSGFGIPMIANNIPGLKNTVGAAGAAVCTEFKAQSLEKAILEIQNHYTEFSRNAVNFYKKTDNRQTMDQIVKELDIVCKE